MGLKPQGGSLRQAEGEGLMQVRRGSWEQACLPGSAAQRAGLWMSGWGVGRFGSRVWAGKQEDAASEGTCTAAQNSSCPTGTPCGRLKSQDSPNGGHTAAWEGASVNVCNESHFLFLREPLATNRYNVAILFETRGPVHEM